MKKVAVIFGGQSSEYLISLKSSIALIEAIDKEQYEVYLIGINNRGEMYYYDDNLKYIENNTWQSKNIIPITFSFNHLKGFYLLHDSFHTFMELDVVFPLIHGENGEDGTLQGLLKLANIPFVGCDVFSSVVGMDKSYAHDIVSKQNILVAPSIILHKDLIKTINLENLPIEFPLFVKPARAGSSVGISKVNNYEELTSAINLAFKTCEKIVLENEIKGMEVGVSIIGCKDLIVSEVDSITITSPFFDYDNKYITHRAKMDLPAKISNELKLKIQKTAVNIYRILDCRDYCRIDMFLGLNNEIYFNEVNTIPGFTTTSRFPNMMLASGYDYKTIISLLLSLALIHG